MTTIAIDGPGGAGKSTLARNLAAALGLDWLDTGAMYRAVTLLALRKGVDSTDGAALGALARSMVLEVAGRVVLDGEDVTEAIRTPDVDGAVSKVAAHPEVRRVLVERQRDWVAARSGGIVEGRDITSVVLPDADVRIYLTAGGDERAARRAGERPGADPVTVQASIAARDALDAGRVASPLVVADGATVIDSTGRQPEDVLEQALGLVRAATAERTTASPAPTGPAGPAGPAASLPPVRPPSAGALRFYAVCRAIAVGASERYHPGPVLGADRLPATGAYVLAPVHRTNLDWLTAARVTRRRLRYLVKDEVWRRSKLAGRLIEALGAFPVDRDAADREALATALGVLAAGEPLVVFPEGTRRSGPTVGDLRDGAAYLALRAGVPIFPVGLGGMEASMPRGAVLPRPRRVVVVVGEALEPAAFLSARPGREGSGRAARVPRSATKALSEALRLALQAVHDEAEAAAAGA